MNLIQHPELNGQSFTLIGGSTGILMLHGFTATTVEVQPLAKFFHEHGYSVSAPLLPGHGIQPEVLNRITWQEWVETASESYRKLAASCASVVLVGESMGALLALYVAANQPGTAGLLLFAPAMEIKNLRYARYLAPFSPIQPKRYAADSTETRFPWQGYTVVPVRAAGQLYRLQRRVSALLPEVHQPVRIYQSTRDKTVNPRGAQMIFDRIGSHEKELIWLKRSPHTILLGEEFDQIAQESLRFIQQLA